ncbi:hypothetical protein [Thermomonas sp.]|uniref:hypothetical protein n=1 Tax=Thermomonas sp. TaxID=1971895 RepID=UPI0035B143CA
MSARVAARPHPAAWLLLLPLPLLLLAFVRYDLQANIRADYRWLLACVVAWHALIAFVVHWCERHSVPHAMAQSRKWLPVAAALPALLGLVVFVGPATLAAAMLLALAALGLGTLADQEDASGATTSLVVGLGVIAAVVGWLLPFPLHQRWLYLALAAVVVMWRRRPIARQLRAAFEALDGLASTRPQRAILLVAAMTVASLGLWLPSLNYDDNAVHLILQSQLRFDGYYHLDVQTQSWAVAPWANNVLHGVAAMLAGGEARAAVASLWLLLGVAGAWRLARALDASPGTALAAAAVFASQPLTGYFTTAMQVDGASTAILLNLAALAAGPDRGKLGAVAVGAICGLLLALKTSNLLYMLPLLAWLVAVRPVGQRLRWASIALATVLAIGGSSYAYATLVTGNPLFPFFNGFFQSPYYPIENFSDPRWRAGISWRSLWDLTFNTVAFGEFYPGAAGIALLALLPAALVDAVRRPASRWLLLWALATGLLVFSYLQYLRYIFPALSVLCVLGVVGLARLGDRRVFAGVVITVALANAALLPTTHWIARENPWMQLLREGPAARSDLVRKFMPERALLERVMAGNPDACVLMGDPKKPFVGAGHGHAISMHRRYDPELWQARNAAEADTSGKRWTSLLAWVDPSFVVVDGSVRGPIFGALEGSGYVRVDREDSLEAWGRLQSGGGGCRALDERRNRARELLRVRSG